MNQFGLDSAYERVLNIMCCMSERDLLVLTGRNWTALLISRTVNPDNVNILLIIIIVDSEAEASKVIRKLSSATKQLCNDMPSLKTIFLPNNLAVE